MPRFSNSLVASFVIALSTAAPAGAAEPLVFGLVDEVTGPQAEAGVLTAHGARLAQEEINAAGGILGRPVELRIEDNQSTNPGTWFVQSRRTFVCRKRTLMRSPSALRQSWHSGPRLRRAWACLAASRSVWLQPFNSQRNPGRVPPIGTDYKPWQEIYVRRELFGSPKAAPSKARLGQA